MFYKVHVAENDGQEVFGPQSLFDIDRGERFDWLASEPAKPGETHGTMHGWLGGNCWSPFVSHEIKERLQPLLGSSIQWHGPFDVRGHTYFFLNCLNVIDCALPGSNSNLLFIDGDTVGKSQLFRIKGRAPRLYCSKAFRDNCVHSGDTGVRFGRIKEDGWEDFPF
jgi:hypothetical protein